MKAPMILMTGAALALGACAANPPPPVAPSVGAVVTTATKAPYGAYLVDPSGRALYMLEGQRGGVGINRCTDLCLRAWPPLHTGAAPIAGPGVDRARLAAMPMHGAPHVTYAGWPLYYYARYRRPGDTTGQHVTDIWGTWHLVAPSGMPIRPRGGY